MAKISVCIPTYEMHGLGVDYLRHSLDILAAQTFRDFDVVISDHSVADDIESLCASYAGRLDIRYFRNEEQRGSSSANINSAIKRATGELIKILFQDDYLSGPGSLAEIADNFDPDKDHWLITACDHSRDGLNNYRPFFPRYNRKIHLGNNTISSPSVLTIKNESPLLFDDHLLWLMDVDYYKRCYDTYGRPKVLNKINVINRTWENQVSNKLATENIRQAELDYVKKKHSPLIRNGKLSLPNVTLVAVSSIKIPETISALQYSMRGVEYGKVLLISHEKPDSLPDGIEFVSCDKISSKDEYSRYLLFDLGRHISTAYALVAQYDGYVVRPSRWLNDFLDFDYIGAPWPKGKFFNGTKEIRVGNGGFSLRSQKLLTAFTDLNLPFVDKGNGHLNEDGMICNYYRQELEESGIRFAAPSLAARFSGELKCAESFRRPFGFHKNRRFMTITAMLNALSAKL